MDKVLALTQSYERKFYEIMSHVQAVISDPDKFMAVFEATGADEDSENKPYNVFNGVAVYSIDGPMLDKGNWYTDWMGMPNYESIADVASQMITDETVNKVLLKVSTPGGLVAGISDVGEVLNAVNQKKGLYIHSGSRVASAGMWLSSYADKIYGSEVAEFGSIGVIVNHMSYAGALEKAGMKATEIKSKERKAVGSPYKDLTKEDKAIIQKKVDETDALFERRIREGRPGVSQDALTGEMFSAHESVRLGLIDGVKTFAETFKEVAALAADTEEEAPFYGGGSMKRKMTEELASAAIESGADPAMIEVVSQEEFDALEPNQETEDEQNAEEHSTDEEAMDEDEETGEEASDNLDEMAALVTKIDELVEANESLEAKVMELEAEREAAAAAMAVVEDMKVELAAVMTTKRVALNLAKVDFSDMSASQVLVEYKSLDKTFKKSFKIGGIAPRAQEQEAPKVVQSSREKALCSSVGV